MTVYDMRHLVILYDALIMDLIDLNRKNEEIKKQLEKQKGKNGR